MVNLLEASLDNAADTVDAGKSYFGVELHWSQQKVILSWVGVGEL